MPTRRNFLMHYFGGGWATDFGTYARIGVQPDRSVTFPYLLDAENLIYELDGGVQKAEGTSKLNSTALASGSVIKGLYDFWITGTAGSSTQKRVCHVGTVIMKDDADGSFSNIKTGLESGKIPTYAVLGDLLVMATDSTTDVPQSWDGTTEQDLAGTPPNFSIVTEHRDRLWASGNASSPSTVYYTGYQDPENWVGSGSGNIAVSPDDGDRVMALASFRNEMWVFKGPYKGSIHRIAGSSPTGNDPFRLSQFASGIGAAGPNVVFPIKDDLGFMWTDGSINTLKAVEAYGDFSTAALTRPIQTWIRERANFARLKHASIVNDGDRGIVLVSMAINSSTNNNATLMLDYRFDDPRWAYWPAFTSSCLASVIDPTDEDRRIVMAGGNDGFIRKYYQATRTIDGSKAIGLKLATPFVDYGEPISGKTISIAGLAVVSRGTGAITFGWERDDKGIQFTTIAQTNGAALDSFILGTDILGGGRGRLRVAQLEEGGEFLSISYQLSQLSVADNMQVSAMGAAVEIGAWAEEN